MEGHTHHTSHKTHAEPGIEGPERLRLSTSATLHCLLGCGLGEVAGIIISKWAGFSIAESIATGVILGFVFGLLLGILPLLKAGFGALRALRQVLIAETLSIAFMEAAEVLVEVYTPGVMKAGLGSGLFWAGMLLALIAGFMAAWPVNYILIGRGIRHQH